MVSSFPIVALNLVTGSYPFRMKFFLIAPVFGLFLFVSRANSSLSTVWTLLSFYITPKQEVTVFTYINHDLMPFNIVLALS
jgi:hypothetical protein